MTPTGQSPSNPEVLASNKTILRRRFPALAAVIDSYEGRWPQFIRTQTSRSGLPTISVEQGTAAVHVHSTFQPMVEAERWVREPLNGDWDFAVVFGMGLGYHLDVLLEQKPQCRLIVIEPRPDVFYAAIASKDQRRLLSHPYLELIVTEDPVAAAHRLFQGHLKDLLDDAPWFVWPATARYASEYQKTLDSQLVDLLRAARGDVATRGKFQRQWIYNFFRNVPFAVGDPSIVPSREQLAGRPAIIAAAGPSLEKNVHLLSEAKGKAVIIAAGSAVNPLLKHGIEPDLLVSFDAGRANYRHFKDLNTPDLPLVYVPTIFPQIVEEYKGPRFTVGMDVFPFVNWLFDEMGEDKGLVASGPSVANVAWDLATSLGLNPIILVGQDLALTDGKTHAAGTAHARTVDLTSPDGQSRYITTEGIDGELVITTVPMYSMKVWFEQRLMSVPAERLTIDATEGGAKIAGTTIMSLRDALETYCRDAFHPYETIKSVHDTEVQRLGDGAAKQRLSTIFADLHDQLVSVGRLAKDGLTDANRLFWESTTKKLTEQRFNEASTRLGRHSTRLGTMPAYQLFIEPVTVHVIRSISLRLQTRPEKETGLFGQGAELARGYVTLFTSVRDMARYVEGLLTELLKEQVN